MIAWCLFLQQNFWERYIKDLEHLFWWNLTNIFLITPSVGVEHFWMDLGERHVFATTHSVVVHIFGGVYVTLDFKSMITFSTRVNKVWQSSTQKQVAYVEGFHHDIWPW
jgi:hypothetical protein